MLRHDFCNPEGRLVNSSYFPTLIDKSPLTSNISQLLKRKEKSGLPYPHNRTFWFFGKYIIYMMHMSEFVLCQTANFNVPYLSLQKRFSLEILRVI